MKMKKAAHTPGPWLAKRKIDHTTQAGGWVLLYASPKDRAHMMRLDHVGEFSGENAQLIAAAPDLLAALDRLMRALAEGIPCECAKEGNENAIYEPGEVCPTCEANAAIAKAEGK